MLVSDSSERNAWPKMYMLEEKADFKISDPSVHLKNLENSKSQNVRRGFDTSK